MIPATQAREWDYVIAGGGTAGCVLAARLSERRGLRILLLEAGGEYPGLLSVPLAGMRQITGYSWKYFTRQQAGLAHRRISLPFGKVLGGSSSNNAMMYYRGTAATYDRWEQLGCAGWNFASMLPYFRKAERWQHGSSEYHGGAGPVDVSEPRHMAPFSGAFVEACLERGIPLVRDFNQPSAEGAGFFAVMQRRGRRASAAVAYLGPARRRVEVETGALVHRVAIEKGRAAGVEFRTREGELRLARALREVILCAGALNSPKILMLSGIGPAAGLGALGIPVEIDLAGVGRNLQDHVRIPVLYESGRGSPGDMLYWIPAALDYAVRRKGVLVSNCCESGAVLRASAEADAPDLQFVTHFQTSLYPGAVDLQFCLTRTASRGAVTLASSDPASAPAIDPNYLSTEGDVRTALAGMSLAREIAQAPALRRFPLGAELLPGPDLTAASDLVAYFRSVGESCYHPAGTCRMGSDSNAVVDTELRVRGVEGLRVVDASVIPELPNGNTCAPVLAIAERAAGWMLL